MMFFGKQFCQKLAQTEMASGEMTKVAVKISQKISYFIVIVSWHASVSSTRNFLTKISNATEIAGLCARYACLQLHDLIGDFVNSHQLS